MSKIVDYDAWQKLQLAPLTDFNPAVLQGLKYSQHSGYLLELERLYSTMYLEWPTLKKDASDMTEAVAGLTWTVAPFCQDGAEPDDEAKAVAKTVSDALWMVSPQRPGEFSHCFPELLGAMVHAIYRSVNVHEVVWKFTPELVYPLEYKQLGPQYYMWETRQGEPDRLMLVPDGMDYTRPVAFEPGRFVVALNTTGPDHPMYNADFYSLVGYFVAAKFGLPGLQSFVKRYGHPLRKFTIENKTRRQELEAKLRSMPDVYDVFLGPGETLDVTAIPAGANVPHEVLLRVAENACHQLIKGNTLTSDVGDSGGSRAQAEVHMGVEASLVRKRGEFVARVLNRQLIPYIVERNYGRRDLPMPELRCQVPEQKANIQKAQYWQAVLGIPGMRVLKSAVHDDLGLAVPGEGDDVYEGASAAAPAELRRDESAAPDGGMLSMGDDALDVTMAGRVSAGGSLRERVERMLPEAMRRWAGPTIERFEQMVRDGRKPEEILARLEELRPDTKVLVQALRAATAAGLGLPVDGDEDAAAANPYGCNQYGEGWASPHNGSSTSYQITGFNGQRRKMLTQQYNNNKVTVRTDKKHPGKDAYPDADDESLNKQAAEERRKAEEAKRKKEEEEKKRREEEERKKKEAEKKAEEEKKKKEEEKKRKAEETAKKKEEAAKRKAEADKKRAEREAEKKAKAERKEKEAAVKTAEKAVKDAAKELKGRITRYSGSRTVSDVTAAMNDVIRKAETAKRELLGDAYFDVKPEDVIPAKLLKQIEATPSRLNATGQAEAEAEIARREPIMKINLEMLLGGEVDDGFGGKKKITGILENDMERVLTFCEVSKYAGYYFRGRMLSEARLEGTNSNDLDGRNHPVCSLLARSLGGAIHHYNTGSYGDTFVRFKPEVRERTTFTGINSLNCDRIGGVKTSSLLTAPAKGQAFTYGQIAAMNRGEKLNDLVKKNYMEAQIRGLLTARHIESIGVPKKRVDGWMGPKTHDSEAETKAGKLAAQLAKVTGRETLVEDGGNHFLVRFK